MVNCEGRNTFCSAFPPFRSAVLYNVYTNELAHIVARHGLLVHQYDGRTLSSQQLQLIGLLCAWLTWKPG